MARVLMKGNEAIAEAAVRAGCLAYFGYPITPQTEILEYMAARMPELGRAFVQAESELGAIFMVYGAACGGKRVMTSTSSPGFCLMQEAISDMVSTETPCLIVNVMRGGPGMGNIMPSQADYYQMTRGGGNGDYSLIVLAPATVQEAVDLVSVGFDLAERYCLPVLLMTDGMLGQIMEPVNLPPMQAAERPAPSWATTGCEGREHRFIESVKLDDAALEKVNDRLQDTFARIRAAEIRFEESLPENMETLVVAYGSAARIARTAVARARSEGLGVGLFRPIIVSPFPHDALWRAASRARRVLVVELNAGQMLDDVRLAVEGARPVSFYGKCGGVMPVPEQVLDEIRRLHLVNAGRGGAHA